jgi:hypothetical protein
MTIDLKTGEWERGENEEYWLHLNSDGKKLLVNRITELRDQGAILLCYSGAAEGRATEDLGIDPFDLNWIDDFVMWKQLTFNNKECQYGHYFKGGWMRTSQPPKYDKSKNIGKDNTEVGKGYKDCVAALLKKKIDTTQKDEMRELILSRSGNDKPFSISEAKQILTYCTSDTHYLWEIFDIMFVMLMEHLKIHPMQLLSNLMEQAEYSVAIGKMEKVGIPVDVEYMKNLGHNFEYAVDEMIENLVQNHWPFFVRERVASQVKAKWTKKADAFKEFLESKGLLEDWPKTDTGLPATSDEVMDFYKEIPEIDALWQTNQLVNQLKWFRPEAGKKLWKNLGSDGRLRVYLNPFGAQTGRNQPPPSGGYILAMSKWLRCVVRPPKGKVILGDDYEAQEFGIAAAVAKDKNMKAAYDSGDPYVWFAQVCKKIPKHLNTMWIKDPCKAKGDKHEAEYWEYKPVRKPFKSTGLGVQFGMASVGLSKKLTIDCGKTYTEDDAQEYIEYHQDSFPDYWDYKEEMWDTYLAKKVHILPGDGWALLKDNDRRLSVQNIPMQGGGASIMRRAVILAQKAGIDVMCPLHDALYAICNADEQEEVNAKLVECMQEGTDYILGDGGKSPVNIRIECDVHTHEEDWVEAEGQEYYDLLKHNLEYRPGWEEDEAIALRTYLYNEEED